MKKIPGYRREDGVWVCPPGHAYGAGDLRAWDMRRRAGRSGVGSTVNVDMIHAETKQAKQQRKRRAKRRA